MHIYIRKGVEFKADELITYEVESIRLRSPVDIRNTLLSSDFTKLRVPPLTP
jgi:hypothetical protein